MKKYRNFKKKKRFYKIRRWNNKPAGINFWTCFDSADLKIWKIGWVQKNKKKKDDIVIKNKKYFVKYIECHVPKIIGDRNFRERI